jgi:hypothetical protein
MQEDGQAVGEAVHKRLVDGEVGGRHGEQRSVARERYSLIDELNHRDRDRLGIGVRRQTTADDFGCDHHHRQTLVGDERALVFGF